MATVTIGHGSAFNLIDNPSVAVTLAGVTSIEFGSSKIDQIDTTDMGTPGRQRTFISGLEDSGDVTLKGNWIPGDTSQAALLALRDGDIHSFEVIYPAAVATETFDGTVTSYDKTVPDDKLPEFTCVIKVSGGITVS